MALMALLAPANKVPVYVMAFGPVMERFKVGIPGHDPIFVRNGHISERLAHVMQQPGEAARQPPARFIIPPLLRCPLNREDHGLGSLSGPKCNLQAMAKQSTSPPVVMSLRCRQ
ncbi:hypothetical protein D3C72_1836290 [compost metagenome]